MRNFRSHTRTTAVPHRFGLRRRPFTGGRTTVFTALVAVSTVVSGCSTSANQTPTVTAQSGSVTSGSVQSGSVQSNDPTTGEGWLTLGTTASRRAYETADPSYYPVAQRAFTNAASLLPDSSSVMSARATLALALHQFDDALRFANDALKREPNSFEAKLARFDATVELGHYDEAATQIDALTDQHPGVASLSRLSYLRQLTGDIAGAEAAMRAAVAAAPAGSFDHAVAQAYLGEVLLERGNGTGAKRAFRRALDIDPDLSLAVLGLARIDAGEARYDEALARLDALTNRVPLIEAYGLQAGIARAQGSPESEANAAQLINASASLFRSNGAEVDAELAVILADQGTAAAPEALRFAQAAYNARQTIFTADALAWALLQSGRPTEALRYAREAIATSPTVATVRWHAAVIFAAVGDTDSARRELAAASFNQWFSPGQATEIEALTLSLAP